MAQVSACGESTFVYNELGNELGSAAFTRNAAGVCYSQSLWPSAYGLGASIAETAFPALFHDIVGTSRLRGRELAARDGGGHFMADDAPFFDAQLDAACRPTPFCDGSIRCLPGLPTSPRLFADDACTQPIAFLPIGHLPDMTTACPTVAPPTRFAYYAGDCTPTDSINDLGAALDPPAVWKMGATGCEPEVVFDDPAHSYFAVAAPVPIDTYVAVQKRVE
jgi:hypothetical protein